MMRLYTVLGSTREKGTVPICRNGPEAGTIGRWSSHKWGLSPFFSMTIRFKLITATIAIVVMANAVLAWAAVSLFQALGGGWTPEIAQASAQPPTVVLPVVPDEKGKPAQVLPQ